MTEHEMRLRPNAFDRIASGVKTVEIRLYDEKRQSIHVGDVIRFRNSALPEEKGVLAIVTDLLRYDSFAALIHSLPMSVFGYPDEDPETYIQRTLSLYSAELEKRYGVVGIRISLQAEKEK